MVDLDAAFCHHLLQIAKAEIESEAKLDEIAVGYRAILLRTFQAPSSRLVRGSKLGRDRSQTQSPLWMQERQEVLTDRIIAVGLLGVPSKGALLADLAKKFGIDRVASTFGWDGQLIAELNTNSGSYLRSLDGLDGYEKVSRDETTTTPLSVAVKIVLKAYLLA